MLMSGPPGSGKTMLARAMPTILPEMTIHEALEVTKIYSVRGLLPPDTPLLRERPFRSPHHGTSNAGLIGGGSWPRPGEVSLAHRGVLFLDELPEFAANTLEMLRQPLEDRQVTVARVSGTVTFPASFMLTKGAQLPHCAVQRVGGTCGLLIHNRPNRAAARKRVQNFEGSTIFDGRFWVDQHQACIGSEGHRPNYR